MFCVMLYVPGTGMVSTAVITPNTCNYCCSFSATAADAGDCALCWCCSILLLLVLLELLLLLSIADLLLKSCCYACGILCLMRLWCKKGSILLGTGNTIWKVKTKNIYCVRTQLSWKVKVMIKNVYIREPFSVKFPEECNCLEIGIGDQLWSDNSWKPGINNYPTKIIVVITCDGL